MNNYGYQPYNSSIVANFRALPAEELAQLSDKLSLNVGIGELSICQNEYRKENRDPEAEELMLICKLIRRAQKKLSAFTLSSFEPISEEEARTFADLRAKLEALMISAPFNFEHIASAADMYIKAAGKKTATPGIYGKCAYHGAAEFAAKGALPLLNFRSDSFDSSFTLGVPYAPVYKRSAAKETDVFIIITPTPYCELGFERAALDLLADEKINPTVKRADTLEHGGAIDFLLDSSKGFYADLTVFPHYYENPTVSHLADTREDAIIVLASSAGSKEILKKASSLGLMASSFARPSSVPTATVRRFDTRPLMMNSDFLRSLKFKANIAAVNCAESNPAGEIEALDEKQVEDLLFAAVGANEPCFESAQDAVILAVASLCAAGANFENISVSFDEKLPLVGFGASDAKRIMSMLLGIYRAQAELCLLSEGSRHKVCADSLSLCVYARSRAVQQSQKSLALKDEGKLFLLFPTRKDGGVPNYDELRKILNLVSNGVANGTITYAKAVMAKDAKAALEEICQGTELSPLSLPEGFENGTNVGFIVESTAELSPIFAEYKKIEN